MKRNILFITAAAAAIITLIVIVVSILLTPVQKKEINITCNSDGTMIFALSDKDVRVFDNPSFIFRDDQLVIITDSKGAYFEYQFRVSDEDYQRLKDSLNEWKENNASLPELADLFIFFKIQCRTLPKNEIDKKRQKYYNNTR